MSDLEEYRNLMNHEGNDPKDEVADFLKKSSLLKMPVKKNKEEIWESISEAIDEKQLGIPRGVSVWRFARIAAAVALIATSIALFLSPPAPIEVLTAKGEKTTHTLPDGSKVSLNASSIVSYSSEWNRELTLDGEAFFEVTKGEKFLVKTESGTVEVLGTSFNVFVRNGDFNVACKTGKVRVAAPKRSVLEEIEPGQAITIDSDTVKIVFRVPESMGNWQKGEFYFDHQPISQVFEELQRQFSVDIDFDGSNEQEFSGYFTNKNLENALEMVCLPLGLEYEKTGQNRFAISERRE
ncbi:MAG: FecR domain-containing protein [Cyclobacteriaceae bacterium]